MRLDIRFTIRSIEDLWCQAVVLPVFERDTSLILNNINRKMGGSIEKLLNSGIWNGKAGEKLLLATQNAIRADKLLIHGMGETADYSINVLKKEIYNIGLALDKMKVNDFGIFIPRVREPEPEYGLHIDTAVKYLAKLYLSRYKDEPDFILRILFSFEKQDAGIIENEAEKLRKYFSPLSDCSIIVEKETTQNNNMSELAA